MRVNALQRLVSVAVSISAGRCLAQTSVARSVSVWQVARPHLSPVLLSLAEVLGFYPVKLRFRGQLEAGLRHPRRAWALHLWLSSSYCLRLPWSPCPPGSSEQKALG